MKIQLNLAAIGSQPVKKFPACLGLLLFFVWRSTSAQTWIPTDAPTAGWWSVACSADGTKFVAAPSFGQASTSQDAGNTWTTNSPSTYYFVSAASSADGTTLAATAYDWVHNGGSVWVSTNSGATWASLGAAPPFSIAISADGTKLALLTTHYPLGPSTAGGIAISTDSGASWTPTSAPIAAWNKIALSADGSTLIAVAQNAPIYISRDFGATWTATTSPNTNWHCVACSADGVKIVAATTTADYPFTLLSGGLIYVSQDSGSSWVTANVPSNSWNCVACSADGIKMAAASDGLIHTSSDSGATWTPNDAPSNSWHSIACSADGSSLVAVVNHGGIWICRSTSTPALDIAPRGTNLVLSWTVPSMNFVLQQSSDLTTTNWTAVAAIPILNFTNLQNHVIVPLAAGRGFYRLRH